MIGSCYISEKARNELNKFPHCIECFQVIRLSDNIIQRLKLKNGEYKINDLKVSNKNNKEILNLLENEESRLRAIKDNIKKHNVRDKNFITINCFTKDKEGLIPSCCLIILKSELNGVDHIVNFNFSEGKIKGFGVYNNSNRIPIDLKAFEW